MIRHVTILGIALMLAVGAFGQTIDGSEHPELIPDDAAYFLYLNTIAHSGRAGDYLKFAGVDSPKAEAIVTKFKTDFDDLEKWYNDLPETQSGSNARTPEFVAKRNALIKSVRAKLMMVLDTDKTSALDNFVKTQKKSMNYAPDPDFTALKLLMKRPRFVDAAFHPHAMPQGSTCMRPNYSSYTSMNFVPVSIPVNNPSFESYNPVNQNGYNYGPIPYWYQTGQSGSIVGWTSLITPEDGHAMASVDSGAIMQTTSTPFAPNTTYLLNVYVGKRTDIPAGGTYSVTLFNGGSTTLASVSGNTSSQSGGTWQPVQVTYTTGSTPPSGTIAIVLSGTFEVQFDNVSVQTLGNGGTIASSTSLTGYTTYNCIGTAPLHTGRVSDNLNGDSNPAVYGPSVSAPSSISVYNSDSAFVAPGTVITHRVYSAVQCSVAGTFFSVQITEDDEIATTTSVRTGASYGVWPFFTTPLGQFCAPQYFPPDYNPPWVVSSNTSASYYIGSSVCVRINGGSWHCGPGLGGPLFVAPPPNGGFCTRTP